MPYCIKLKKQAKYDIEILTSCIIHTHFQKLSVLLKIIPLGMVYG